MGRGGEDGGWDGKREWGKISFRVDLAWLSLGLGVM